MTQESDARPVGANLADDLALLFPIGHALGATVDLESKVAGYRVRVGPDVVTLSPTGYAVWGLAHGGPERDPEQPWGRLNVLTAAAALDLDEDPTEQLDALLEDGLLAEVEADVEAIVDFGARYRLVPLMLGLGNTSDEPGVFQIGLPGTPVIAVSGFLYDLYQWGHLETDLAAAVRMSLDAARGGQDPDADEEPVPDDPAALLGAVLPMLHYLLGPNAAYLDTRRLA